MNSDAPILNRYPAKLPPTPLVPIQLSAEAPAIWCKLEFLNPSGSTKDRISRYILERAVASGRLSAGGTVIEASSGSTSIAMALTCAQLGLRFVAVLPEHVSNERLLIIRAYGGGTHLVPKQAGIRGCIGEAERVAREIGAFLPRQFSNPENVEAHQFGTAREILEQIPDGRVDAVVSGVGTGGTLVGLMRAFSGLRRPPRGFLARPVNLGRQGEAECCSFSARIPGVLDCVSTLFDQDEFPGLATIEIDDEDAMAATRALIRKGFPVGPSSGLNYRAAMLAAERVWPAHVVTVLPDRMERYFTTDLFQPFSSEQVAGTA